ncbi:DUF1080 domain-containing protein [bacterium]|nr:DUF1080 domain-containing protein [bacterium]RQV95250.1 MAG: DUF1080 domain-containing protein [bacterium]
MKKQITAISFICIGLLFVLNHCSTKTIELWNGKDFTGWEFILENDSLDVSEVWSVRDGVIYCKGIPNGYMRTESEYSNYTLYLDWRWPENESNSGVLLHMQAPDQVWPICIECQLRAGRAGDFVLMGSGTITVDGETYNNTRQFLSIGKIEESTENPIGEWNSYRIICQDNKITCYVNDILQNAGTEASLSEGRIGLQSEGGQIEFRNIRLEPLN